jgi:hypothetical protein
MSPVILNRYVTLEQVNRHMPVGAANDRVRQAQLETYLPLLDGVAELLDSEHIDMLEHHCDLPLEVRKELRAIMNRAGVLPHAVHRNAERLDQLADPNAGPILDQAYRFKFARSQ